MARLGSCGPRAAGPSSTSTGTATARGHGGGRAAFVKVHGQDSRDGDLLYRAYRLAVLRGPADGRRRLARRGGVEHEALLAHAGPAGRRDLSGGGRR